MLPARRHPWQLRPLSIGGCSSGRHMSTIASTSRPSPFAVFRNRPFTLLWTAQLISTTGSALTSLAASILVFRLTGSALSVGLMLMATALPTVFVGLIAGVVVDRFDRKRIMIAADLIRAVLVCAIPFLLPSGVAWLYIIVMLSSAVGQFFIRRRPACCRKSHPRQNSRPRIR